jgi:membrane associated rhomboid family serine protease
MKSLIGGIPLTRVVISAENASVTLVMVLANVLGTLWMGGSKRLQFGKLYVVSSMKLYFMFCTSLIDVEAIMAGQYLRILTSKIVYDTMGQAFVSLIMLYSFRQLERQIGSRKFGAFVFMSFTVCTLLELAVTSVLFSLQFRIPLENGPYFFIFSLLPMFYCK